MCGAKVGKIGDTNTFINPITFPKDKASFDKIASGTDSSSKIDYEMKDYNTVTSNVAKTEYESSAGY